MTASRRFVLSTFPVWRTDSTLDGGTSGEENSDPDNDEEHQGVRASEHMGRTSVDNDRSPIPQSKRKSKSMGPPWISFLCSRSLSPPRAEPCNFDEESDGHDGVVASDSSSADVESDIEKEVEDNASAAEFAAVPAAEGALPP
ncbi:hypothetical protein NMY22_g8336 [Coprinellus aureogranulatus]|nr:hypothetical protein NMY22_g8336 [Coprinellus aureogranulatus]